MKLERKARGFFFRFRSTRCVNLGGFRTILKVHKYIYWATGQLGDELRFFCMKLETPFWSSLLEPPVCSFSSLT